MTTGRPDPASASASRRRALARRHHPDLGGDPERFIEVMREFDRTTAYGDDESTTRDVGSTIHVRTTRRSRVRRSISSTRRAVTRRLRCRIPRSVPGARRYGHL